MTRELIGDFHVGDRVLTKVPAPRLNGSFMGDGTVGAVVGMGNTADRILVAFEGGNQLVNMLPTEVQPLSEEQASIILRDSAQSPAHNHTMVHRNATAEAHVVTAGGFVNHIR